VFFDYDYEYEGRVEEAWHVGCVIEDHAEKNRVSKVSGRDAACIEKAY